MYFIILYNKSYLGANTSSIYPRNRNRKLIYFSYPNIFNVSNVPYCPRDFLFILHLTSWCSDFVVITFPRWRKNASLSPVQVIFFGDNIWFLSIHTSTVEHACSKQENSVVLTRRNFIVPTYYVSKVHWEW